jgi:hypothetical protein
MLSGPSLIYSWCPWPSHLRIKLLPARLPFHECKTPHDVSGSACAPNQPGSVLLALFIILHTATRKNFQPPVSRGVFIVDVIALWLEKIHQCSCFSLSRRVCTNSTLLCVVCLDGAIFDFVAPIQPNCCFAIFAPSRMC